MADSFKFKMNHQFFNRVLKESSETRHLVDGKAEEFRSKVGECGRAEVGADDVGVDHHLVGEPGRSGPPVEHRGRRAVGDEDRTALGVMAGDDAAEGAWRHGTGLALFSCPGGRG